MRTCINRQACIIVMGYYAKRARNACSILSALLRSRKTLQFCKWHRRRNSHDDRVVTVSRWRRSVFTGAVVRASKQNASESCYWPKPEHSSIGHATNLQLANSIVGSRCILENDRICKYYIYIYEFDNKVMAADLLFSFCIRHWNAIEAARLGCTDFRPADVMRRPSRVAPCFRDARCKLNVCYFTRWTYT